MEEEKCSLEKEDIVINEANAPRGICVTGFPSKTTANELVIHFQKRKHGGGDIECIHITEKRVAVIVFDESTVADSVLKKKQRFSDDVSLTVKPLSEMIETANTLEIFQLVTAWIHDGLLKNHTRKQIGRLLDKVKDETNIEWHEASEGFLMTGTFQQVKETRGLLSRFLKDPQNLDLGSSNPDWSNNKGKDDKHTGPARGSNVAGGFQNELGLRASEGSSNNNHSEEEESADLKPQHYESTQKFFPLFVKAHEDELQKIEKNFKVNVSREVDDGKVTVAPTEHCTAEKYHEGCEAFITLYQKVHKRMKLEQFIPRDEESPTHVRQRIRDMGKAHPVLVEVCEDRKHWKVYGEDSFVENVLSDLQKERLISRIAREAEAWSRDGTDEGDADVENDNQLEHKLGSVKLSVLKGDITDQHVDVIVNAANTKLDHGGGVAGAIIKKGGRGIQKESDNYIKRCGLLHDGEVAVTGPGRLHCKSIIHAVGPMWRNAEQEKCRKALKMACHDSLAVACGKGFKSIAFPAISSGIYGMPKDICAKVMFDAVEEYVRQRDPSKQTLTDIRFVIIDDPTVKVFKKEFMEFFHLQKDQSLAIGSKASNLRRSRRGKKKGKDGTNDFSDPLTSNSDSPPKSFSDAVKGDKREDADGGRGSSASSEVSASGRASKQECAICLDTVKNARTLKCKHVFCADCVKTALTYDNRCPVCKEPQGIVQGNQPRGEMQVHKSGQSLPGYHGCGRITINYNFPSGIQGPGHPNPGEWYGRTSRTAYLPDNQEGREVLALLRRAFDARLIFTVGTSVTSGLHNQITWNDIHHKTNVYGGPEGYGYPDPDYLRRVKEDLAAKGIR